MCPNERQTKVRAKLRHCAKGQKLVTFKEVGDLVNTIAIGVAQQLLIPINEAEHSAGRPLLTAIVINKRTGRPGCGFFVQARELGVMDPHESNETFWQREVQRVFDYYKSCCVR